MSAGTDEYLPGHGDPSWSALHYDLDLEYAVDGNRLSGKATIECGADEDLRRLSLDLAGLEATKVAVNGKAPARWAHRGTHLVVTLADPLPARETFTLTVRYRGRPQPLVDRVHGDAGWEELTDGVIVASQPHGAPSWFPCNDRPDDKATYRIAVTTEPEYVVVANGTLTGRRQHGSSVTWVHEMLEPMATYLATVQIGRYRLVDVGESGGVAPVQVAVPDEVDTSGDAFRAGFGRQDAMMRAFVERFGPYPFDRYCAVITADDLEIPLESQGLSTFGTNFVSEDWSAVRLVAHELAHQWFGNAVTLRSWRDIWLHEGPACYAEWLWSEASGAGTADEHARRHHERLAGLDQDLVLADPGPELMFDDRVYKRGALTLHALRLTVGDDTFFAILRAWVGERAGGTGSTDDFVRLAVDTASDHDAVEPLLTEWLRDPRLPDLPAAS